MTTANCQVYQQSAVFTASPQELTLMLYNGAIKFCNICIEGIESGQVEKVNTNALKAQRILEELQFTLDDSYEIALQIRPLYEYINHLLIEGNIKKDKEKITEAKELFIAFRDLWKEVMKKI
jgi:flagellar protein FliS